MKVILFKVGLFFLRLISFLPMPVINVIGGGLGNIIYFCAYKRRQIGLINLKMCFPQMPLAKKRSLLRKHFQELVQSSLAYGLVFFASPQKLSKLIKIRGYEYFKQHHNKKPVIILTGHFVALELGAIRLTMEFPGYSLYANQRDPYITAYIKKARSRFNKEQGGEIFSRQEGLKVIVRKMQQTLYPLYYLPDQDMDERESIYVPFFAHSHCATLKTLPRLTKMTDAIIVPFATYREGNQYIAEFFPSLNEYPTISEREDVTSMNRCLETMIMKHPEQYLWIHKRFKTQPGLKRGILYER